METFCPTSKLIDTQNDSNVFGRIGGPSSAFMSWPAVKPYYNYSTNYLPFSVPELKADTKEPKERAFSVKDTMGRSSPMTSVFLGLMQRRKRRENRPRRQRTTFTSEQTLKLELEYNRTEYISRPRRYEIAKVLNLSENQIKIWFQNRRAKEKRIEKAHIDQQIRNSGIPTSETVSSPTSSYPLCTPYMWPYTPASFNRLFTETDNKT